MATGSERYVPKVHPATRAVESEDPMTLHATSVAGDPEVMVRCVAQEYGWMGMGTEEILRLFRDPAYPALHALLCFYGEAGLRARLAAALGRTGVFRFQEQIREEPQAGEPGSELIQLGIRSRTQPEIPALPKPEGSSHAEGQ
jgi:hypothetical protein